MRANEVIEGVVRKTVTPSAPVVSKSMLDCSNCIRITVFREPNLLEAWLTAIPGKPNLLETWRTAFAMYHEPTSQVAGLFSRATNLRYVSSCRYKCHQHFFSCRETRLLLAGGQGSAALVSWTRGWCSPCWSQVGEQETRSGCPTPLA